MLSKSFWQIFWEKTKNLIIFFLFLFLFLGIFFLIKDYFQIKTIILVGEKKQSLNLDFLKGRLYFLIDESSLERTILEKNYFLKKVEIKKIFPDLLEIRYEEKQPVALILIDNQFYYLSVNGDVLFIKKEKDDFLPIINFYQKILPKRKGQVFDYQDLKKALFFVDKLSKFNLKIKDVDIKSEDVLLFNLKDEKKIYLSLVKNQEDQLFKLKEILKNIQEKKISYKEIDLRFDKAIIRF